MNKFKIGHVILNQQLEPTSFEGFDQIPNISAEDLEMFQTLQRVGFISNPERTAHLKSKLHKKVFEYGEFTRGSVTSSVFRGIGKEVKGRKKRQSSARYRNILRKFSNVKDSSLSKSLPYFHTILFLIIYLIEFGTCSFILFKCNMYEASTFRVLVPLLSIIFGLQIMIYNILNHKSITSFSMILVNFMLLWMLEIASAIFLIQRLFGFQSHGIISNYLDNPCDRNYELIYISFVIVDGFYPTLHLIGLIYLDRKDK